MRLPLPLPGLGPEQAGICRSCFLARILSSFSPRSTCFRMISLLDMAFLGSAYGARAFWLGHKLLQRSRRWARHTACLYI